MCIFKQLKHHKEMMRTRRRALSLATWLDCILAVHALSRISPENKEVTLMIRFSLLWPIQSWHAVSAATMSVLLSVAQNTDTLMHNC